MSSTHSRKTFRIRLEHMIGALRADIMTGRLHPGAFLPSERELVSRFHLSNKLVRVGLEQLVSEGLIVKLPRVGNQVADTARDRKATVRFGYHRSLEQEADMNRLLELFHTAHPSVYVHPIPLSFQNYHETVANYLESGLLDAVTVNVRNFEQFKASGGLSLLCAQQPSPSVYPSLEQAFTHEDALYVRPLLFSPLILCYNPLHFQEKDLPLPFRPNGWDDLMRDASLLSVEDERFGFYSYLLSNNRWPIFLLQNGAKLSSRRERAEAFVDRVVEGISYWGEIIYNHRAFPTYLSGKDTDAEELFAQGKVSIIMTTYFALNALRESGVPFDIAPLPSFGGGNDSLLMTIGIAVNRISEVRHAAQALADFLCSEQAQRHIRERTLSIPSVTEAAEAAEPGSSYRPAHDGIFRELLPRSRPFTDIGMTVEEMDLVLKEARLFWSRLQTKDSMRKRIRELLQ
ncbi:extracellular solute-binding protein [Paenibacillus sp.]|uniref:extracellular solute-binding protein n=1 Tax=Paenibacillus sp. TaxID=58172 RepID=UPI002810B019|nr:extracellular solute-binding protein [Paenibacillus sp.]